MINEKLEDLMYRAGLTAQGCLDSMDQYDREAIERFAELIVRECAKLADESTSRPFQSYGIMIKEHFGVKE